MAPSHGQHRRSVVCRDCTRTFSFVSTSWQAPDNCPACYEKQSGEKSGLDVVYVSGPAKFAVKQSGNSVAGLDAVTIENANLQRIVPESPLHYLAVGEHVWGEDSKRERYFIIRVE